LDLLEFGVEPGRRLRLVGLEGGVIRGQDLVLPEEGRLRRRGLCGLQLSEIGDMEGELVLIELDELGLQLFAADGDGIIRRFIGFGARGLIGRIGL
jgi:hypothetical protein